MKALLDTNVLMDFVDKRKDFYEEAEKIFTICARDEVDGFVSAHSLMDLCYLVRKSKSPEERLDMLRQLCTLFTVVETTDDEMIAAAERMDFKDFEDSVVNQAAIRAKVEYIITRNQDDFTRADNAVVSPDEFVGMFPDEADETPKEK